MSGEMRGWLYFSVVALLALSVMTVGCNAYSYLDTKHVESMADRGYVRVTEMLPGSKYPVSQWVKAEE